jgi:hypothetical protein
MAEIFLQDLDQNRIKHMLEDGKITYYNRYVDDIFIICNQTKITHQILLEQLSAQHKDLHFTINEEVKNQIAYLDLTNKHGKLEIEIYRKPTTAGVIIHNNSCHYKEQKLAAYKNWIHRLLTLHLTENNKNKKLNTVINIAINNGYKKEDIRLLYNKYKLRKTQLKNNENGSPSLIQDITYGK